MVIKTNRADRLGYLERQRARCDGNSRSCINRAVEQYDVYRRNADGERTTGQLEQRQTCGYHRVQFLQNAMYEVVAVRPLPRYADRHRTNS